MNRLFANVSNVNHGGTEFLVTQCLRGPVAPVGQALSLKIS